jgi:hypothetical protein
LLLPRAANLFSTSSIVAGIQGILNISVGIANQNQRIRVLRQPVCRPFWTGKFAVHFGQHAAPVLLSVSKKQRETAANQQNESTDFPESARCHVAAPAPSLVTPTRRLSPQ